MSLLEFWRNRPLAAALLAGGLLGLVLGAAWPIASPSEQHADGELGWALPDPAVVSRFDESRFAELRELRIWGAAGTAGGGRLGADGKPVVLRWHLTGIILEPEPMALVLADGAPTVVRVAIGGALPDEARLISVTATEIVYERDGCRYRRVLYGGTGANEEGACVPLSDKPDAAPPAADDTRATAPTTESESTSGPKSN